MIMMFSLVDETERLLKCCCKKKKKVNNALFVLSFISNFIPNYHKEIA